MLLHYPTPRKHHIRGPYIYAEDGNVVEIPLRGGPVEVDEEVAHKIISKVGDIIKVFQPIEEDKPEDKPEGKKATGKRRSPRRKDVKSYVTKGS